MIIISVRLSQYLPNTGEAMSIISWALKIGYELVHHHRLLFFGMCVWIKGGAHSNHYRMQECTSSRPHPTTHHKPLTANDIHTILYSIRLHANVYESINGRGQNTYARVARTYIIHEAGRPLGRDYIRTA